MNLKNKIYSLIYVVFFICAGHQLMAQEDTKVYKGYVYRQDGTPFENALVTVMQETQNSKVATDSKGYYEIEYQEESVLVISFPQYFTKTVYPKSGKELKTFLVKDDRFSYDRSYNNMIKDIKLKNASGSLISILPDENTLENETADDIWKGSVGIYSEKQSGMPGAGSLNIMRGIHSLYTNHSPVIIIDGMFLGDYEFEKPSFRNTISLMFSGLIPEIPNKLFPSIIGSSNS